MGGWVRLDTEKLDKAKPQALRGVNMTVRMSPYDVPEAIRGHYDPDLRRFVIEFRYIGDEPLRHESQGEYITLRIGRHSGRLYGIEVDVEAMEAPTVGLHAERKHKIPQVSAAVLKAIDTLAHRPLKQARHENYEAARGAIAQKEHEVFESLAAG